MTVTETTVGNKPNDKMPFLTWLYISVISFPFRLLSMFVGRRHDYKIVTNSEWSDWYPFPTDGHKIERKIIAETGFDDYIKFYNLRTSVSIPILVQC